MNPFFKYWWDTEGSQPFAVFGVATISNGRPGVFDTSEFALKLQGLPVPPHPTFEEWVAAGRPIFERPGKIRE